MHCLGSTVCFRALDVETNENVPRLDDAKGTRFLHVNEGENDANKDSHQVMKCVTTSPCGNFVAADLRVNVSANFAAIRCWRVKDRKLLQTLRLHKGEVVALAFSPCSKFLASLGVTTDQHQLVLWRLQDGKTLCGKPTNGVTTLKFFSRDSSSLITTGGDESSVVVWKFDGQKRSITSEKCRLGQIRRDVTKFIAGEQDTFAFCGTKTGGRC